jgi:hypothetical protein
MQAAPSFDADELLFYKTERERIAAHGITDYDLVSEEIARRWAFVGGRRPIVTLNAPLDSADVEANKLALLRQTSGRFVYAPRIESPSNASTKKRKRDDDDGNLLHQLKKDTLQMICQDIGTTVSGNKDELIVRIVDTAQ